jgi:hypothetical protein
VTKNFNNLKLTTKIWNANNPDTLPVLVELMKNAVITKYAYTAPFKVMEELHW